MQVSKPGMVPPEPRGTVRQVEEWFDLLPSWAAFVIACILIGWAILWFFLPFFVYLIHANLIGLRKDLARLERRGERVTTPPGS